MSLKIYIAGELVPAEEAKVSVFDHGLLYGDGVFEGIRAYNGKIFRLKEHIERLYESASAIQLEIPISPEAMSDAMVATLQANGIQDGYIRAIVTRGAGTLGLDPNKCSNPQIIIIADSIALYPKELYETGLNIITSSIRRTPATSLDPRIKSLNYLNNILAKIEGLKAGCIEALMLNHKGEVSECTGDNLFIVQNGVLVTPPVEAGILEGITRNAVMELAAASGIVVKEASLSLDEAYNADECFLTGNRCRSDRRCQNRRQNHRHRQTRPCHERLEESLPRSSKSVAGFAFV